MKHTIKIYNSLSRKKELFKPADGKTVKMYVCGPTVYDIPHIGHARSAYVFDVIRRYFTDNKRYKVKFVRNVTDIDDKIINQAKKEFADLEINTATNKVAEKYLKAYHEAMKDLNILPPTKEPKATEYIDKMGKFIEKLIKKGKAYKSESGGDVYFDTTKAENYGTLSNQNIDALAAGARVAVGGNKRNPLDFALWKGAKEGEAAYISKGLDRGRPGWHIECSVMSSDILGDKFDIHGGGIDLIFPHHENELAQSRGAGKKFARFWIHNGLLTINKEKMAKSLGNFITIEEIRNRYPLDVLKLLFLQAHYSHPVDFSWEKMEETKKAYERIEILKQRLEQKYGTAKVSKKVKWGTGSIGNFREQFTEAMDDDFNMSKGLAVLFEMVHRCNVVLDSDDTQKDGKLAYATDVMQEICKVFGLSFTYEVSGGLSDNEVEWKISTRNAFRKNKRYKDADQVRKELEEKGIILEDSNDDTTWRRKL